MGVPAFFRWLSEKYPKILQDFLEQIPIKVGSETFEIDYLAENPNGVEYDNLYIV